MLVTIRKPPKQLSPYVREFVYYTDYDPGYFASRMLPEPVIDLLIPLDEEPRCFKYDGSELVCYKGSIISGIQNAALLAIAGGTTMLAVRFTYAGAKSVFRIPASHLTNRTIDADCLLGREVNELQSRLFDTPTVDEMFTLTAGFLANRLCNERRMEIVAFVAERFPVDESISMKKLADYAGYSHKQFIRLFRDFVGVTPKMFQRLKRFQHSLEGLFLQETADWQELVYRFGFYDQAHFINEFKTLSGYTPTGYLREKGDYVNYIPLNQDPASGEIPHFLKK